MNLDKVVLSDREVTEINEWLPDGFRFGSWLTCFYCGTSPTERDHVVPYSMLSAERRRGGAHSVGATVPTCHECNMVLSSFYFDTLSDRCDYLNKRLRRRYSKMLHMEAWQPWEIDELKGALRGHVHSKQEERSIAIKRVSWQFTPEFTKMHEDAHKQAVDEFPSNKRFIEFMKPKWS